MATVGLIHSDLFQEHLTGPGHPEQPQRLRAVLARLGSDGLTQQLDQLAPKPATDPQLQRVHPQAYLERVRSAAEGGQIWVDSPDAPLCLQSERVARHAAGAALQAVDQVLEGHWQRAFVAARPPGHHAEESLAMGFCLFNNAVLAARHARAAHALERVAIIDWDVHHGNGTQHLLEEDGNIFYGSLHQSPHYPGTGLATDRGRGDGEGATLNCPLPPGTGDKHWRRAFEREILPALEDFAPELVIVSAGFDAHELDPLSDIDLHEESYAAFTHELLQATADCAGGRMISLLEGGYHLDALASSAAAHVAAMLEAP